MFKTINDIKEYIHYANVEDLPIEYNNKMTVSLFGNEILLEHNPWMWHLHLKVTNACNCKCKFCVEQNSTCAENATNYLLQVEDMLTEMEKNNILYSVSVTGGEPMLFSRFQELCELLNKHNISFLTLNTNGYYLHNTNTLSIIDNTFDFMNISRHSINDDKNQKIFQGEVPMISTLKDIKNRLHHCKMRLQCVITDFKDVNDFLEFIDTFDFADDLSFRKLMKLSNKHGVVYDDNEQLYFRLLDYAFENFNFKEQTIQDYYIYEIWNYKGIDITFSYSNMRMLYEVEKNESDKIIREFIIHPNGIISGSWDFTNKVIKEHHTAVKQSSN